MTKRIIGAVDFLIGVLILLWIGYNYLIEMQQVVVDANPIVPYPIIPLVFSVTAICTGWKWMTGKW